MGIDGIQGPKGPAAAPDTEGTAPGRGPGAEAGVTSGLRGAGEPVVQPRLDDPTLAAIVAQARVIAADLRAGRCESREEATRRLVREVLSRRLKVGGAGLSQRIGTALKDDPRLAAALERIWSEDAP